MTVDEIVKIIQLYTYQNIYSEDSSTSSSKMFENMLLEAIKSVAVEKGSSNSTEAILNSSNTDELDKINTQSSKNTTNNVLNNDSSNINAAISLAASKYGVEEEFIKAVIKQESSFNANAVSKSGAQGLMQLMPSTSRSLGVENPFNVLENIDGGTRYLKRLMETFDGNKQLALSAYNGGIGRMNRLGVDTVQEISKMPRETENYVSKVMKAYNNYKKV